LHNNAPPVSYGSKAAYYQWTREGGMHGIARSAEQGRKQQEQTP
jgi:hypothetical protein